MAGYSIFALGESQITVSGGAQLDGVTQGDGSHLVGHSITLNSNAWTEVAISDDDTDFRDNDGSQRLDGAQNFDGTTYGSGTRVEAEFGLTLSDGTNSWQVVGFNIVNSSPAYGTIEGLAFVGGPGGFPPVGVPLTVTAAQEGPNFEAAAYATPVCFAHGTRIATPRGGRRIETLRRGDLVCTLDRGPQPVRWVGARSVVATGRFAPVRLARGVLGAQAPLWVSQQHRILLCSGQAEMLFGLAEAFAPAAALVGGRDVRIDAGGTITYLHVMLPRHEVILANGVACESLHGAGQAFFRDAPCAGGPLARPVLRRQEAGLLRRSLTGPVGGAGVQGLDPAFSPPHNHRQHNRSADHAAQGGHPARVGSLRGAGPQRVGGPHRRADRVEPAGGQPATAQPGTGAWH